MIETIEFCESVACTLEDITQRTINLTEQNQYEDAAAIISEWTTTSNSSILTHYLQEQLAEVSDELLYFKEDDGDIAYGTFSFLASPELPTDNI